MARSMTAYGRAHTKTMLGQFLIEIHSVNRKTLDINTNLPKEILEMDMAIRKALSSVIYRGSIFVRLTKEGGSAGDLRAPSLEILKEAHLEWTTCAKALGYDPKKDIPFSMVMNWALSAPSGGGSIDETFRKELMGGLEIALDAFLEMKLKEGKALIKDIAARLDVIEKGLQKVEIESKKAPDRFRDRLSKRMEELQIQHEGDADRLARELVIFTDRIDITEEITRLSSHVKQFQGILKEGKVRVGRELDFLTQEMNREVNTIASKSQELTITQTILMMKSELDKIREQLQNIE